MEREATKVRSAPANGSQPPSGPLPKWKFENGQPVQVDGWYIVEMDFVDIQTAEDSYVFKIFLVPGGYHHKNIRVDADEIEHPGLGGGGGGGD
ncbi:MAG TPA: hypothetical protein PKD54_02160 [Pirellulaceae bacterium]|nr:hypothetical protein [Pirellulaceae bacterium]